MLKQTQTTIERISELKLDQNDIIMILQAQLNLNKNDKIDFVIKDNQLDFITITNTTPIEIYPVFCELTYYNQMDLTKII